MELSTSPILLKILGTTVKSAFFDDWFRLESCFDGDIDRYFFSVVFVDMVDLEKTDLASTLKMRTGCLGMGLLWNVHKALLFCGISMILLNLILFLES